MAVNRHPAGSSRGGQFAKKSTPADIAKNMTLQHKQEDYLDICCNDVTIGIHKESDGWQVSLTPTLSKMHLSAVAERSSEEYKEITHAVIVASTVAQLLNRNVFPPEETNNVLAVFDEKEKDVASREQEDVDESHRDAYELLASAIATAVVSVSEECRRNRQPMRYVPENIWENRPRAASMYEWWDNLSALHHERDYGSRLRGMVHKYSSADPEVLARSSGIADLCNDSNGSLFSTIFYMVDQIDSHSSLELYEAWPTVLYSEYAREGHTENTMWGYAQGIGLHRSGAQDIIKAMWEDKRLLRKHPMATIDITAALMSCE